MVGNPRTLQFRLYEKNATKSVPLGGAFWDGGAATFVLKGTNDRWVGTLRAAEIAAYEKRAITELGPECAHWLATGELTAAP